MQKIFNIVKIWRRICREIFGFPNLAEWRFCPKSNLSKEKVSLGLTTKDLLLKGSFATKFGIF